MMTVPTTLQEYNAMYGNQELDWFRVTGSPKFDYPIDYSVAILSVDERSSDGDDGGDRLFCGSEILRFIDRGGAGP